MSDTDRTRSSMYKLEVVRSQILQVQQTMKRYVGPYLQMLRKHCCSFHDLRHRKTVTKCIDLMLDNDRIRACNDVELLSPEH